MRWTGLFTLFVALVLFRTTSIIAFARWLPDEECVVYHSLGFLGGDLNPRWFGYGTLPMYLHAGVYSLVGVVYYVLGIVDSRVEFAQLIFTRPAVFYVTGRVLCSLAHTTACLVLASIIARHYRTRAGAVLFFLAALMLGDSIEAANWIRVDTFVFLFLTLTIYFGCFAKKSRRALLLSVVFAGMAFACKTPAVAIFPVLCVTVAYDVCCGRYRKKDAMLLAFFPVVIVACMPYMVLDWGRYAEAWFGTVSQASGGVMSFGSGKEYEASTLNRLLAPWGALGVQCGFPALLLSFCVLPYSFRHDSRLLFSLLFVGAYTVLFSTSPFVDSYWLRPCYPFILFFGVVLVTVTVRSTTCHAFLDRLRATRGLSGEMRIALVACLVLPLVSGVGRLTGSVKEVLAQRETMDTRIVASDWITDNLPEHSRVVLVGNIPQYLPVIPTVDFSVQRKNFGVPMRAKIPFVWEALRRHMRAQAATREPMFDTKLVDFPWQHSEDEVGGAAIGPGSYVVISDEIYQRYETDFYLAQWPDTTPQARDWYDRLRQQELLAAFEGHGPKIKIYLIAKDWK